MFLLFPPYLLIHLALRAKSKPLLKTSSELASTSLVCQRLPQVHSSLGEEVEQAGSLFLNGAQEDLRGVSSIQPCYKIIPEG